MTSYRDFAVKYEGGMTIMEIVAQGKSAVGQRTGIKLITMSCRKIIDIKKETSKSCQA